MLQPYVLNDFSGGVNLRGAPLAMGETDLLNAENMYPVASGYMIGRAGQSLYTHLGPMDINPIKSLYRFYKQNGSAIQLSTSGISIHRLNDANGAPTAIDGRYTTSQRFSFTTWTAKDKVYWINGSQALRSYDGTTVAAVAGSPPIGTHVEFFLDRLWILQANGVRFSDLNVDNVWQGAALLNISDNKGGVGSFLKAANRVLIAAKTSGLWRLDGSPLLGNAFVPYSNVGCIAPWTADVVTVLQNGQVVPVGVAFLGTDGVYVTDGFQVTMITPKIDPLFSLYFRNAVGKYYPKKRQYFLSFNSAGAANDTLWVGSNIDVSGSRVAWTPYTGFRCDSFCVWDGGNDNGELLSGRSDNGHIRQLDVGTDDVGTDYRCGFTTRYIGDPKLNKQVRWLKPVFDAQTQVHYSIDYFQKQYSSGPVVVGAPTALIWDVGQWDVDKWAGPTLNSARTSILDFRYGRYLSVSFSNTGDGPAFRFFQLEIEARIKNPGFHDLFTLNANP